MVPTRHLDRRLMWAGFFLGPTAWAVHLQAVYALSAPATDVGNLIAFHAISLLCLLATLAGGFLAWRSWRSVGGWLVGTETPAAGRVRFLTVVGMMAAGLFAWVIVAQWMAVGMLPLRVRGG